MSIRFFTRFSRFSRTGFGLLGFGMTLILSGCTEREPPATSAPPTIDSSRSVSERPFSPETQDWPHDISNISPDPRVKYGRLKNGLRYAVLPVQDKNDTISIQLNIAAGFNQEPENAYGVAHLLEHVAFRANDDSDDTSIIHDLQSSGVGYGSDFNGYTQPDNTYYRLNLVSGNKRNFAAALETIRVLVDLPDLTVENMEAEKKVVLAELKQRDTVQARANQSYLAFSNPQQPRNKVSGIGTPESLAAISLLDLQAFKAAHYVPGQALLVIAGDINLREAEGFIQETFSDWKKSEMEPQYSPVKPASNAEGLAADVSYQAPKTKSQLNAIERKASTYKSDIFDVRKRAVLEQQMSAMLKTRIDRRVEDETAVSWIKLVRERNADNTLDGVQLSGRDWPLAMTIFEEERRRAIEFGFTSQELDYANSKRLAEFKRLADTVDPYSAWREASRLRTQYTGGFVYTNTGQELEIFEKISAELTLEDYNDAARDIWAEFNPKYWTQSSRSMTAVLEDVKAARVTAQETVLTPPDNQPNDGFQKAEFEGVGSVKSRDVYRREKVQRVLFENGVRLNYKVSDAEPDEIRIFVALRESGSKHILESQAALAEKVIAISRADIEGMDADIMDRHFVGKRADFQVKIIEDRLALYVATNSESLQAALELLSTFLVKFDPESADYQRAFEKQIRQTKTAASQSPLTSGFNELSYAYSGQSAVFKSRSINRPSLKLKVDEKIEAILKTASIQVGVYGDFDPSGLENAFVSTLGAMPARPDVETGGRRKDESVTRIDPDVRTLTYKGSSEQMALFYCWPVDIWRDAETYAETVLLSSILKNRLRENLREDLGVTYSPHIFYQTNRTLPNFNFVCLSAQIDPKNELKTHEGFKNVIAQFKSSPITKSDLNRAREPILTRMRRSETSSSAYAQYLSKAYSDPEYMASKMSLLKAISAVKPKSLNTASVATYDRTKLNVFRVQHGQKFSALDEKTLEIKSYLGDVEAQFSLGKRLMYSPEAEKIERGIELMNLAGAGGKTEAYIRVGEFHSLKYNKKEAATAFEAALPSTEASYHLGSIYFNNYNVFPDVPDARVIQLLRESAEGGLWRGQHMLAERLKDGTMTPRDEIGALKWALISNHRKNGELSITDEKGIARFITGLTDAQITAAQEQAQSWVRDNPNISSPM